jgi:hypothetical protein
MIRMLLQTNSYLVPHEKRDEHTQLMRRFRQLMLQLGCDHFEVHEQVDANWNQPGTGRFVQILRFHDRRHYRAVRAAEQQSALAQELIREFCMLVDLPGQQAQGSFTNQHYRQVLWDVDEHAAENQPQQSGQLPSAGASGVAPQSTDHPPPPSSPQ